MNRRLPGWVQDASSAEKRPVEFFSGFMSPWVRGLHEFSVDEPWGSDRYGIELAPKDKIAKGFQKSNRTFPVWKQSQQAARFRPGVGRKDRSLRPTIIGLGLCGKTEGTRCQARYSG